MPTLIWFISQSAPEKFFRKLRRIGYHDLPKLLPVLLHAHAQGWVTILGSAAREPEDVAAIIQEHFDASTLKCVEAPRKKKNG